MKNRKLLNTLFFSTLAFALSFGVVACDSSDDGDDDGASTSGDGDGDGDGGCSFEDSQDDSCPAYTECALNSCQAEYETCLGADYLNGNFSGSCADYMDCNLACACDDTACQEGCYNTHVGMSGECFDCLVMDIGGCAVANCSAELQECSGA